MLEINANEVIPDLPLKQLGCWDSISILSTVAIIEDLFHVSVTGEEVEQCEAFNDIILLIADRKNG